MNAAVVKRTQEALGKVIRRPPLTEKLLSKPPFRYLHDIITEVIRTTGFMKGLYTDAEMKSDNVKDKDAKMSFLQKAIDVVVMVSGEPLSAKPARIVAGHEPERTNELLQKIGKCCLNKLSSEEVVKRVLAGERGDRRHMASVASRPPPEADGRNGRAEEPRGPKDKEDRRNPEKAERSTSRDGAQKDESKPREKERARERPRGDEHERRKDPERDRTRMRARRDRDLDRGLGRETERKSEGGRDRERRRAPDGEHSRDPDRERGRELDRPERKPSSSGEVSKKLSDGSAKEAKGETEAEVSTKTSKSVTAKTSKRRSKTSVEEAARHRDPCHTLPTVSGLSNEPDRKTAASEIGTKEVVANSAGVSDDHSPSLWRDGAEPGPAVTQKGDSPSDAEGEAGPVGPDKSEVPESSAGPSELPASIRRLSRPGSARPAPPRVKRQDSVEVLTVDRTGSGQAISNVIVEAQNSDHEEDEQFVVEAAPQLAEMSELEAVQAVELEEDEKHGGLVKKILETKKDYEKLQLTPKPGEKEKPPVLESAWRKEKDIVSKEIEKLRMSIQTLCKSALPLGKTMDYLQEDVDAMQHELQLWHSENKQHAEALLEEQSITDSAVEPLRAQLVELEQLIKDQQDKICAVKANILRNEEKIQKMVYSINLSSRR